MFELFLVAAFVVVLIATFISSRRGNAEMIESAIRRRTHRNSIRVKLFLVATLSLGAIGYIVLN